MILTLEVTGPQAARLGASGRKLFRESGGSIGRLPRNDWSLPDPFVSSRHAVISHRNGVFYIEDASRNGISLNSPDNRLVKGVPHPLKQGDWIFIEPYEITVSIADQDDTGVSSPFDDLFGSSGAPAPPAPSRPDSDPFGLARPAGIAPGRGADPLEQEQPLVADGR
jgi:type VI secretion system FHA domain protein